MSVITKDLGAVTAYAAAVNRGYTGTKEEFETLMASYATVAQQAAQSASNASQSATDASQSATDAETAKGTAQQAATDAQTAQASAQGYAQSAQQSAQSASQSAQDAESAKETAVDAVDGFAAGAQQALDSVNQAGNNWKSLAQAQKLDAEAWALGTRDGEDVGSSDPAYHNNAKYYAESAATDATTASDAAQTATTKASEAAQSASAAAESAASLVVDTEPTEGSTRPVASGAVYNIKEDLNNAFNINNVPFEWGTVYNGNINSDQNRIHTVNLLWAPKGTVLKTSASYSSIAVPVYAIDGTYKTNGVWVDEWEASEDCYIRPMLRKPSGNIAESEFAGLISDVSICYPLQAVSDSAFGGYQTAKNLKSVQSAYGIIDAARSDNISLSNLFDKTASGNTITGYYDRTNTFVTNGTIRTSDYIRVLEGLEYYTNLAAGGFELWFDKDKNFIGYTDVAMGGRFTPKASAVYLRAMYLETAKDSFTVFCDEIYKVASENSPYAGKNGVAFGTSLTYRAQTTGGYLQFLPALSGANIENKGLGNSTILDNGSNPKMMDVITGYANYTSKDFAILEGFVNDWYNNATLLGTWKDTGTSTVCGCVRTAIQHILTQNPSITLILVIDTIGKSASGVDCSSLAVRGGVTQTEFYDEIAKVADSLGIPTIRADRNSGMSELTPYMYIDNIHPNAEGAEQTAITIWASMKNIPIKVVDTTE